MQLCFENQTCRIHNFSSDIFQQVGYCERANTSVYVCVCVCLCVCVCVCVLNRVLERTQYPGLLHLVIQDNSNLKLGTVKTTILTKSVVVNRICDS